MLASAHTLAFRQCAPITKRGAARPLHHQRHGLAPIKTGSFAVPTPPLRRCIVLRASGEEHDTRAAAAATDGANTSAAIVASAAAQSAALAPSAPSEAVLTTFTTHYETSYGQVLKIVGALEELGAWQPDRAPTMTWTEGHVWTLDAALPPGANVEFKVVMADADGGTRWEGGGNRSIDVPATVADTPTGSVGVACAFGDTAGTRMVARPDKGALRARLAGLEARVAALFERKRREDSADAARARLRAAGLDPTGEAAAAVAAADAAPPTAAAPPRGGSSSSQQRTAPLLVPLIDPSELPPISPAATATGSARPSAPHDGEADDAAAAGQQQQQQQGEGQALQKASKTRASAPARGLGAVAERLLGAARGALSREATPTVAVALGHADCEALQAAAFVAELEAAAAALERDLEASAAARGGSSSSVPAPSTQQQHQQQQEPPKLGFGFFGRGSSSDDSSSDDSSAPAAAIPAAAAASRWAAVVARVLGEAAAAAAGAAPAAGSGDGDGPLLLSSADLAALPPDADPAALLTAALERVRAREAELRRGGAEGAYQQQQRQQPGSVASGGCCNSTQSGSGGGSSD